MSKMRWTRREFLRVGMGAAAGAVLAGAAEKKDRPNFVFILVDDLRHDALGCTGHPLPRTPNMDALAARGVRFTNAFVTCSICSPSRAACLTGRYGSANGVMKLDQAVRTGEPTFARELRAAAGYRTALIGKWHLRNTPAELGFDIDIHFHSNGPYRNRAAVDEGKKIKVPEYIDAWIARRAVEFIEGTQREGKPFALFLCTQAPHMPWTPGPESLAAVDKKKIALPGTWRGDLAGKPPYIAASRFRTRAQRDYAYDTEAGLIKHIRQYHATVAELDAALEPLMKRLEREDLKGNTWVILIGDNGWQMGEHGLTSKVLPYETSIRVPLVIAGPGTEARTEARMALNIDLAPTMLELAGVRVPEAMHGRSLAGVLAGSGGGDTGWRESFLYEALEPELESQPLAAVRTRRHKYVQTFDVNDREKIVFEELYDLERDPEETRNLAGEAGSAELKAKLKAELERMRKGIRR